MIATLLLLWQASPSGSDWAWEDFPVFVWRQRYAGAALPDELIAPFGGTNVVRDEEADWVREAGHAFYVTSAAGRNDLHLDADDAWEARVASWMRTRAPELLVRAPCLSAPATLRRLEETLARSLAARGGAHGLGLSLGDEIGLTPSGQPFDFCRSKTCDARWRAWAKERGWPERAPLTDDVRLALSDGDLSLVGPWLARRRFARELVGELVEHLALRCAGAPSGLLGISPPGAFEDVDLAALSVDFAEVYPGGLGRELLRSSAARTRALGTVFLQERAPADAAWQVWEHWLHGADGLVLWNDGLLEDQPEHRRRVAHAVERIRDLDAAIDASASLQARIGILHDQASIDASWLRDALQDGPTWPLRRRSHQVRHGTYERRLAGWTCLLEDRGFLVDAWPLEPTALDATRSPPGALLLVNLLVVAPQEALELERYVSDGGLLIVDGELAWIDRRGTRWDTDLLARLESIAPGRVLRAPRGIEAYPTRRRTPARVATWGHFIERVRAASGARVRRLRISTSEGVPFSLRLLRPLGARGVGSPSSASSSAPSGLLCMALPNLPTPADRSSLGPLHLTVEIDPLDDHETTLEWLHPAAGEEPLPAGDAALFRIVDRRADD